MTARGPRRLVVVSLIALTAGCGPLAPVPSTSGTETRETAAPKRIKAATMGAAHTMYQKLNISNGIPGIDALAELVGANLARPDPYAQLQPQLAQTLPTLENGLWKTFPDGPMEVTWKLNPAAQWHDGVPSR